MKQHTLNANAWHFRLANYGRKRISDYEVKYGTDFCAYMRAVLQGAGKALLVYTFSAVIIAWVGYAVYDVALLIMNPQHEVFPTTVFIGFMLAVLAIMLCGGLAAEGFRHIRERIRLHAIVRAQKDGKRYQPEPGFLTLAYRKFKDKTCFRIKFED